MSLFSTASLVSAEAGYYQDCLKFSEELFSRINLNQKDFPFSIDRMIEHYAMLPTNLQKDTVLQVGLELEQSWKKHISLPLITSNQSH